VVAGITALAYPARMDLPHILVVDDDLEIRDLLGDYLGQNAYRVTTVPDGPEMRLCLKRTSVDLLVLDIMLKGDDGLELCREVRAHSNIPVIMLTARGEPLDKAVGLEMGADDYLSKPFLPRELLARIKSILHRVDHSRSRFALPKAYRFGSWTLHTASKHLTDKAGVVSPLSGSEYRLLLKLLVAENQVLSRAQLADGGTQRANNQIDRSVDMCVSRLRHILGEDARESSIIKTVHGEGYIIGVDIVSS
jgi:two-component system OmpR family response regulator